MVVEGSNGSGKTTLLRCLAGMVPDYEGRISRVGAAPMLISHNDGVSGRLTAIENLQWYAALRGLKQGLGTIMDGLKTMGLMGFERTPCGLLSAGQRRRVMLTRLLLEPADLWLLDEANAALDAAGLKLLQGLYQRHFGLGGIVILSTHQAIDEPAATYIRLGANQSPPLSVHANA